MTQNEFWSLYDNGTIQCKTFEWEEGLEHKVVTAFEYNGKLYLRITTEVDGTSWYSETKHRMTHTRGYISTKIKEFNSKEHANNYFKKIFEGCKYRKVQG